jgi:hypothetical protein
MTKEQMDKLAERTSKAYSYENYGAASWRQCIRILAKRGYDERQIEAILRSKWMRWAGSVSDKPYGKVTSADLARFLNDPGNKIDQRAVDELTRQTFPEVHQS